MKKLTLLTAILVCVLALAKDKDKAAKPDPWAGTWKLDISKSTFPNPAMAPKDETVTTEAQAPGSNVIKWSAKGTGPDGQAFTESYDGKSDGQPYALLRNGQEVAKVAYHRDNDHQYSSNATGADGTTSTGTITLDKSGKIITIKEHVKSPQGEFDQTVVFTKT